MNQHPGWLVAGLGILITACGVAWAFSARIPWLGRLPGDIAIERENFRFYFPVVTCVLLSLVLTACAWLFRYFSR
ncbi:MAG: DUF2905 domain-containing protein [Planctomycetota bacterium]|nr:DUF2905 domain-containing protein [Planctomycetota bacterium]MDA1177261.1 DUF2905 domain-containing protein [Planctomycetota bacterium]